MKKNKFAFLHVGTHKTGTTSIQSFLRANQILLSEQNYKVFLFKENFHVLAYYLGFGTPSAFKELSSLCLLDDFEENFRQFLTSVEQRCIISSEVFFENSNNDNLNRLKDVFYDFDVKIIVYIRRQDEYAVSAFKESVRHPFSVFDINYHLGNADWFERIEQFSRIFGEKNVIVRVFESKQLVCQDLICDFCDAIGLKIPSNFDTKIYKDNTALPDIVTELLKLLNSNFNSRAEIQNFENFVLRFISKDSSEYMCEYLTYDERINIYEKFLFSNQSLALKYLGRENNNLFSRPEQKNKTFLTQKNAILEFVNLIFDLYGYCKNK